MKNLNEIYGVKIINGINQTIIWKVLKNVCDQKDQEGERIVKDLYKEFPDVFEGAKKCLILKNRIAYIDSIVKWSDEWMPLLKIQIDSGEFKNSRILSIR